MIKKCGIRRRHKQQQVWYTGNASNAMYQPELLCRDEFKRERESLNFHLPSFKMLGYRKERRMHPSLSSLFSHFSIFTPSSPRRPNYTAWSNGLSRKAPKNQYFGTLTASLKVCLQLHQLFCLSICFLFVGERLEKQWRNGVNGSEETMTNDIFHLYDHLVIVFVSSHGNVFPSYLHPYSHP